MKKEMLFEFLKTIPYGKVVTYKDCAIKLGNKNYARCIGNWLHNNPDPKNYPCYKVVNSKGRLASNFAFGGIAAQRSLLEAEGIEVKYGFVDLKKYRYIID